MEICLISCTWNCTWYPEWRPGSAHCQCDCLGASTLYFQASDHQALRTGWICTCLFCWGPAQWLGPGPWLCLLWSRIGQLCRPLMLHNAMLTLLILTGNVACLVMHEWASELLPKRLLACAQWLGVGFASVQWSEHSCVFSCDQIQWHLAYWWTHIMQLCSLFSSTARRGNMPHGPRSVVQPLMNEKRLTSTDT